MESKDSSASQWCQSKVAELHKKNAESTLVFVVDEAWLDAAATSVVGPQAQSKSFKDDLKLSKAAWFYHAETHQRSLLLYYKPGSDTQKAKVKEMRGVAKKATKSLQEMKIAVADFIMQCPVDAELIGNFENSFHAANFEQSHKIREAHKVKDENAPDSRVNRLTKNVETYDIHADVEGFKSSQDYLFQMAMARAKEESQRLAIVRGSDATPCWMEEQVMLLVKDQSSVKEVRVIRGQELLDQGMNLFHAVGRAAISPPRAIFIHYVGRPADDQVDLAFVGKGITYDTGGLNIKLSLMDKMHGDKGGSTAVLGALKGCMELKVQKNILFCCAFAENAIGSGSYKPSDILRAMNGLSVEIGNTDAEGRLVLADTATYVQRHYKPKKLAYIATLTGSCMVALGVRTAGLFCHDDDLLQGIKDAAEYSDEPVWHMPLNDEHREAVKGQHGTDLDNLGSSRWGGACTAAAFLEAFIEDERPWAHIDIAGPGCLAEGDQSGFGAKLLLAYLTKYDGGAAPFAVPAKPKKAPKPMPAEYIWKAEVKAVAAEDQKEEAVTTAVDADFVGGFDAFEDY